jgi:hypothetical protein
MPDASTSALVPPTRGPDQTVKRMRWEKRLIEEWAPLKYPNGDIRYNMRLGPTQRHLLNVPVTPQLEAMLRVANWYADAVVFLPHELLVIEAKVDPLPEAIGQVLFYSRLVYQTPELESVNPALIVPLVLFGEDDTDVSQFARSLGCRVEIYTPAWIADYLVQRQFRRRLNPQTPTPAPTEENGA